MLFKSIVIVFLATALVVEVNTLSALGWAPEHLFYTSARWVLVGIICRTILWMGDKKKKS